MEVDKRTRGHTLIILKRGARLDCRKYSFSQRVVNNWNALPAEAVSCTTVNSSNLRHIYRNKCRVYTTYNDTTKKIIRYTGRKLSHFEVEVL